MRMNYLSRTLTASLLGMMACCIGFTACSDDDDNHKDDGGNSIITNVHPENVFKNGLPKSVSGMTILQNKEGLVTEITTQDGERAVFEYGHTFTRSEPIANQARITVTDERGGCHPAQPSAQSGRFCESLPFYRPCRNTRSRHIYMGNEIRCRRSSG